MNYQVCYKYDNDINNIWYARFFTTREQALNFYHEQKDCTLFKRTVKILRIGVSK